VTDAPRGGKLRYLGEATRRFLTLLVGIGALTIVGSLVLGAFAGAGVLRSISLGFYLVGCFLLVAGFFIGNRGPVRLRSEEGTMLFGSRVIRWATPAEREETINQSAIFVVLGFVLIVLGVVADDRHRLL
jgi:hypothetical protein